MKTTISVEDQLKWYMLAMRDGEQTGPINNKGPWKFKNSYKRHCHADKFIFECYFAVVSDSLIIATYSITWLDPTGTSYEPEEHSGILRIVTTPGDPVAMVENSLDQWYSNGNAVWSPFLNLNSRSQNKMLKTWSSQPFHTYPRQSDSTCIQVFKKSGNYGPTLAMMLPKGYERLVLSPILAEEARLHHHKADIFDPIYWPTGIFAQQETYLSTRAVYRASIRNRIQRRAASEDLHDALTRKVVSNILFHVIPDWSVCEIIAKMHTPLAEHQLLKLAMQTFTPFICMHDGPFSIGVGIGDISVPLPMWEIDSLTGWAQSDKRIICGGPNLWNWVRVLTGRLEQNSEELRQALDDQNRRRILLT